MTIHMQIMPRQHIIYDQYYRDACHMIHNCYPLQDYHKHTSCHPSQQHHHHHDHDSARINPFIGMKEPQMALIYIYICLQGRNSIVLQQANGLIIKQHGISHESQECSTHAPTTPIMVIVFNRETLHVMCVPWVCLIFSEHSNLFLENSRTCIKSS